MAAGLSRTSSRWSPSALTSATSHTSPHLRAGRWVISAGCRARVPTVRCMLCFWCRGQLSLSHVMGAHGTPRMLVLCRLLCVAHMVACKSVPLLMHAIAYLSPRLLHAVSGHCDAMAPGEERLRVASPAQHPTLLTSGAHASKPAPLCLRRTHGLGQVLSEKGVAASMLLAARMFKQSLA